MPQAGLGTRPGNPGQGPEPDADQRYLAVGVPLGRWQDPDKVTSPPTALIRRGEQFLLVDLGILELFVFAVRPRRRSELLEAAEEAGVEDPARTLEAMLVDGLLILLDDESDDGLRRLRHLRLHPIGIGLGNDSTEPGSFRIARHDLRPLLVCDSVTFAIWAASDGRSLDRVCREIGSSYGVGPDDVLRHVVQVLPGLLESGAVFLDWARDGAP
jgi:hypothetical protein